MKVKEKEIVEKQEGCMRNRNLATAYRKLKTRYLRFQRGKKNFIKWAKVAKGGKQITNQRSETLETVENLSLWVGPQVWMRVTVM